MSEAAARGMAASGSASCMAEWKPLSRFLHVDLAPARRRNGALDSLARRRRLELPAIVAALRALRRVLIADRLLRRLGLSLGHASSTHGRAEALRRVLVADRLLRRLGLSLGHASSTHDRAEYGSAASAVCKVPQYRAARKHC